MAAIPELTAGEIDLAALGALAEYERKGEIPNSRRLSFLDGFKAGATFATERTALAVKAGG